MKSRLFGRSDGMICNNLSGIAIAGNILVDIVNVIDKYPQKNMLCNICTSKKAVGGCVCNTIIDLAKMDSDIPLMALGKVGNDEYGDYSIDVMRKYGVNIENIVRTAHFDTSYTQVMTEKISGERTFFCYKGANSDFGLEDINVESVNCRMFHAGYILLLDKFDESDSLYGTKMARLLHNIQSKGIKTSIDVVSEENNRFAEKILPAAKYCDYVFMNEIECCKVFGLKARNSDGMLNIENIKFAMSELFVNGVREKVVIHSAEGGFAMNKSGEFTAVGSLVLPEDWIFGSVGAGDAYTAACLYGIYCGYDDKKMLEFAAAAAACNLSAENSIDGMKSKAEIEEINKKFNRRVIF